MGNVEKEIKENYVKNLKADEYVSMMSCGVKGFPNMHRIPLTFFYEIMVSGRFKGSTLLEIGSGALVHNIASASAFYPNIIMSDFVEDNCEALKGWLKGESKMEQLLDIPAEVEGCCGDMEASKQMLEKRIKKCVKQVVRGDVLNDNFFLEEVKPEVAPPYDLIISSLCLESSAPDFDSFILVLKRINKLLRLGGGLLLVGFLKGGRWQSGETLFHYLKVDENDIKKALNETGFGNIDMKIDDFKDSSGVVQKAVEGCEIPDTFAYEHEGYYCLAAEKMTD